MSFSNFKIVHIYYIASSWHLLQQMSFVCNKCMILYVQHFKHSSFNTWYFRNGFVISVIFRVIDDLSHCS